MGLTVALDAGRTACVESIDAFLRAVDSFNEYELLAVSRCHGWSRLDVIVHVIAGWHEMLGGMVSTVDSAPSVDAASYWPAFTAQYSTEDPVATLMSQRRRTASYARPDSARAELQDVAAYAVASSPSRTAHDCGRGMSSQRATSSRSGRSRTSCTSSTCSATSRRPPRVSRWRERRSRHWSKNLFLRPGLTWTRC